MIKRFFEVATTRDPTAEKIASFSNKREGWHFGEGCGASQIALKNAQDINRFAHLNGWSTEAFPGISGEILISLKSRAGDYYETILEVDGTLTLIEEHEGGDETRREKLSVSDVINTLSWNSVSACAISASFIPTIGVQPSNASFVWRSETLAQLVEEASQSLSLIVPKNEAKQSARMWQNSTASLRPPSYSGRSSQIAFQCTS